MKSKASVSILMNGYNCETYLRQAIESVYAQSYRDWEIIFIDNGSTDATPDIVKSYDEKIAYYRLEETLPLGEARNIGLQHCGGSYIAFLDTDDIWLSEKLALQVAFMEQHPHCKMCYGGVIYIDEKSHEKARFLPAARSGNVFPQLLRRYEINMQSVLLRNDFEIRFNDTMQFSPDYDLFMKTAARFDVGVINDYLVKYRELSNSLTSKKIDRWGIEVEQTLNDIFSAQPELCSRYPTEYQLAYAKVAYYKARYAISTGNRKEARRLLSPYKSSGRAYLLLYLLTFFPAAVWHFLHKLKQAVR